MDGRDETIGSWNQLELSERSFGVRFSVHVRPKSSRSAVLGVRGGGLEVALTAAPADGAANTELVKLLARTLGTPNGSVKIVVGASSRNKVVEVNGLGASEARERLSKAKR